MKTNQILRITISFLFIFTALIWYQLSNFQIQKYSFAEDDEREERDDEDKNENEEEKEVDDEEKERETNTSESALGETYEYIIEKVVQITEPENSNEQNVTTQTPITTKVIDKGYNVDSDGDKLVDAIDPNPTIHQSQFFTDDDNDGIANAYDAHPGKDDYTYLIFKDTNGNGISDTLEELE